MYRPRKLIYRLLRKGICEGKVNDQGRKIESAGKLNDNCPLFPELRKAANQEFILGLFRRNEFCSSTVTLELGFCPLPYLFPHRYLPTLQKSLTREDS